MQAQVEELAGQAGLQILRDEYKRLSGTASTQNSIALPDDADRITLAATAEKYFENCEARGLDPETIRKYGLPLTRQGIVRFQFV